ncbi:hypothetical protein [Roseovarius aestuariivivens]|uniref:hypothetical protein n=1 Tax=Roseovarius aestuariivivens TaxID=1888910 RepID=UPI001080D46B|nr:hypothetical protein [Roseovarius aestuariivivens]
MIVANMATYPAREANLDSVISAIAPQVQKMNVVLNEFTAVPEHISAPDHVTFIIPEKDTKDTGKFLPDSADADYVFTIDDDIQYPADYVSYSVDWFEKLGDGPFVAGYHASWYIRRKDELVPELKRRIRLALWPHHLARYRKIIHFAQAADGPLRVEQLGTGTAVMRGRDYPAYAEMASSQKFVDVRFAAICHAKGLARLCLPRAAGWLAPMDLPEGYEGGDLYADFTSSYPKHVTTEIKAYAFDEPQVGAAYEAQQSRGCNQGQTR